MKSMLMAALILVAACGAYAQTPPPAARFEGSVVLMSGSAEIEVDNDEAVASFYLEVQDADLARAQSQLNQRVSEGVAALKRADPKAQVQSAGYGSSPVYGKTGQRTIVAWRVRQSVTLRTTELALLPRAVAAGQQQLLLGGVSFGLSRATRERQEAELIRRATANFNERVGAAAAALNVPAARVRIEELNFGVRNQGGPPIVAFARGQAMAAESRVEEPTLDPGRTTMQQSVDGKVRFLLP